MFQYYFLLGLRKFVLQARKHAVDRIQRGFFFLPDQILGNPLEFGGHRGIVLRLRLFVIHACWFPAIR